MWRQSTWKEKTNSSPWPSPFSLLFLTSSLPSSQTSDASDVAISHPLCRNVTRLRIMSAYFHFLHFLEELTFLSTFRFTPSNIVKAFQIPASSNLNFPALYHLTNGCEFTQYNLQLSLVSDRVQNMGNRLFIPRNLSPVRLTIPYAGWKDHYFNSSVHDPPAESNSAQICILLLFSNVKKTSLYFVHPLTASSTSFLTVLSLAKLSYLLHIHNRHRISSNETSGLILIYRITRLGEISSSILPVWDSDYQS